MKKTLGIITLAASIALAGCGNDNAEAEAAREDFLPAMEIFWTIGLESDGREATCEVYTTELVDTDGVLLEMFESSWGRQLNDSEKEVFFEYLEAEC